MRVLKFLFVVVVFFSINTSQAGKYRPIYYFFTNGARLAIIEGEVHYTPPNGRADLKEKTISLSEQELLLLPESTSQTGKGSSDTVLGKSPDTPLLLQTRPAQAIPIMWTENTQNSQLISRNHLGIMTQDGHFFKFEDAIRSLPDLR